MKVDTKTGVSISYSIEGDILTMTTYDGKEIYVFQLDGDNLIFQKSK